jgi:hypothetical protein
MQAGHTAEICYRTKPDQLIAPIPTFHNEAMKCTCQIINCRVVSKWLTKTGKDKIITISRVLYCNKLAQIKAAFLNNLVGMKS